MPEGPEVETIRVGLLPIVGRKITDVRVADHKKYKPQRNKIKSLQQYTISDIQRRGKFLVFYFDKHSQIITALNHLGMTGVWYLYSDSVWQEMTTPFKDYPHWKVYFHLDDGSHLLFVNVRTFGRFEIYEPQELENHPAIAGLGPDILADEFDTDEFIQRMRGKTSRPRTKEVGKCLLDYNIVAGCGNIYKNEALFLSGINPFTPANMLTDDQLRNLGSKLSNVANLALKFKGSTLRDYRHVDGYSGLMQNQFSVYDREGEPCVNCSTAIERAFQGDRSSFWCPSCQNNYSIDTDG